MEAKSPSPVLVEERLGVSWPRETSCAGCGATLRVGLENLRYGAWVMSGPASGAARYQARYTFSCPACGEEGRNRVPEREVPLSRQLELQRETRERQPVA